MPPDQGSGCAATLRCSCVATLRGMIGSPPDSGEAVGSLRNVLRCCTAAAEMGRRVSKSASSTASNSGRPALTTLVDSGRGASQFRVGKLGSRGAAAGVVNQLLHCLSPNVSPAHAHQLGDHLGLRWSTAASGEFVPHPLHGGQHGAPWRRLSSSPTRLPGTPMEGLYLLRQPSRPGHDRPQAGDDKSGV